MLPLRSYWPALLLLAQEACCPRHPVDPASLERCSCLCSESISSVTEKSVIFVQELSFPQTVPTDDANFQPELGWSVKGSLGWTKTVGGLNWRMPDRLGCDEVAATLTCEIRSRPFSAKNQEKRGVGGGFARGHSDA